MVTIIGIRRVEYTNKQGREVKGYNLYFAQEDSHVVGKSVGSEWIGNNVGLPVFGATALEKFIGRNCELSYNKSATGRVYVGGVKIS